MAWRCSYLRIAFRGFGSAWAVAIGLGPCACSPRAAAPTEQVTSTTRVLGVFVDAATGAPVSGLTVTVFDASAASAPFDFAAWPLPPNAPTAASYAVAADTVGDAVTALVWQRNLPAAATRTDAVAYCDALSLAGFDDWRLPNRMELLSIINTDAVFPVLDSSVFPGMPAGSATESVWFWSTSTDVQDPGYGWGVDLALGVVGSRSFASTAQVRCVRGGKAPPVQHYAVSGRVIQDLATGLAWQAAPSFGPGTLADATTACQNLQLGAWSSGWRLPGKKEMESIIDMSTSAPSIAAVFQPGAFSMFWTSSAPVNATDNNYQVVIGWGGTVLHQQTQTTAAAWCVHIATP